MVLTPGDIKVNYMNLWNKLTKTVHTSKISTQKLINYTSELDWMAH
jgi:hypothetical protein